MGKCRKSSQVSQETEKEKWEIRKASAHFFVGRDGEVFQGCKTHQRAFHAEGVDLFLGSENQII
jgi:N-acetyl-anhydromuramyl-L-alanine amidase AmpD